MIVTTETATNSRASERAPLPAAPRWVTWVTYAAFLVPLPYSLSRVLWAVGIPAGFTEAGLREIGAPGGGSILLLALAVLSESVALLTHQFLYHQRRTLPRWLPVLAGRQVSPWAVILPATLVTAVLLTAFTVGTFDLLYRPELFNSATALPRWSVWAHQVLFLVWGLSLGAATLAYYGRTRDRHSGLSNH